MSSSPSSTKRGTARSRRRPRQVNRATQRAMEIRRAETLIGGAVPERARAETIGATTDAAPQSRVGRGPSAIPRALEMHYIRHDLRRLIFTAAALLVVMVVLLVVLSGVM